MNAIRLIMRLFKRWFEEPVGIFYGLLVFFALRVPDQISDMLTEVVIYADGRFDPANWWAFAGFVIAGLTLSNTVWFWLTSVNRTEICIDGGRLQQIDFLDEVQLAERSNGANGLFPADFSDEDKEQFRVSAQNELAEEHYEYPVWPYRMASSAAAALVIFSVIAAAGGTALEDALNYVRLSGTFIELFVLFALSLTFGYYLAATTADGYRARWSSREEKFRLRFYHLVWLYRLRGARFDEHKVGWRFTNMWRFSRLVGIRDLSFFGALILTALAFLYFFFLDDVQGKGEAVLAFGMLFPILAAVNAYCLANLFSARAWLRETRAANLQDLETFFDDAAARMDRLDAVARRRARGVTIALTLVSWAVAVGIFFFPALADNLGTMFRSSATVILLSMAFSVAPIALTLTLLRDLAERIVQWIAQNAIPWLVHTVFPWVREALNITPWTENRTNLLIQRTRDGNASPVRVIGRGLAFGLFALALIAPPWWLEATTRWPGTELYAIEGQLPARERPNVETALNAWYAERDFDAYNGKPIPLVIVASAGGASRSAAWFMTVMHELHVAGVDEKFDDHLFAISSVSGGSLGAVTYALNRACGWRKVDRGDVENLAKADLLKTSASRIFSADLVRRLPVVGIPVGFVDDRNQILEKAFETHWKTVSGFEEDFTTKGEGSDKKTLIDAHFLGYRTDDAFNDYCKKEKWDLAKRKLPHLLLNGVDVETGQRIVTSSIDISDTPEIMPNAIDFFDDFKKDIRLSAAVMNSARFPLMSPAGLYEVTLSRPQSDEGGEADEEEKGEELKRQIIDGGYFENNGIETALDLIAEIERLEAEGRLDFDPDPALFLITNNATAAPVASACPGEENADWEKERLFHFETLTCEQESLPKRAMQSYAAIGTDLDDGDGRVPELLAPIRGLFQIRDAHGQEALLDARKRLCKVKEKPRFFHVGLPKPTCPHTAAPMNWVLHEGVARYFMHDAIVDPHVQWQIQELARFIEGKGSLAAKSE